MGVCCRSQCQGPVEAWCPFLYCDNGLDLLVWPAPPFTIFCPLRRTKPTRRASSGSFSSRRSRFVALMPRTMSMIMIVVGELGVGRLSRNIERGRCCFCFVRDLQ